MKTPICSFDAKTGVLCPQCENKLKSGILQSTDVEGAIKLSNISLKHRELDKFTLVGCRRVGDEFVLILKTTDVKFLRSNQNLAKAIHKEFQCKVWFVEADSSPRTFLENLFAPARIINTNMIWLPDGNKVTQVTMVSKDFEEITPNIEKIKSIALGVRNIDLMVQISK
jgi:transcription antitermination factor NusA-like protein